MKATKLKRPYASSSWQSNSIPIVLTVSWLGFLVMSDWKIEHCKSFNGDFKLILPARVLRTSQ